MNNSPTSDRNSLPDGFDLVTPADNLSPEKTLFVPFLGQSNGEHMSIVYEPYQPGMTTNDTSGAIILEQELTNLTGGKVVTSSDRNTNFAVGGSKVNGNGYYLDYNYVWWYPESYQPGGALIQAHQRMNQWLIEQGAQPDDEIAIVWSQGESDVGDVSSNDPGDREQYKQAILSVFDYFRNNLGYENITFYIVPTGRLQPEGAANIGLNPQEIAIMNQGVAIVRDVQTEIATERDDVHLAPDYSDLNMVYEEGLIYGANYDQNYYQWSGDFWHLGHDGLKVNGSRLAQYIAVDQGQSNVISFTDSFGNPADSISLIRAGLLDIDLADQPSPEVIKGTDNPDVVVGTLAADEITGQAGNDIIFGGAGIDTLTGGAGRDIFFYDAARSDFDRITEFELKSDYLDVSEPLQLAGYTGSDPIADGYIAIIPLDANNLEILFDVDGAGEQAADTLVILENVDIAGFQDNINGNFVITPTEY